MEYTIDCVSTDSGWRYRVMLWCGRVTYRGDRDYAGYRGAEKAAAKTGAVPKDKRG